MVIAAFPSGPFATNAYIISCENTHHAAIIDPAPESAEQLIDYLNQHQLKLKKIILTHSHWDHFADLNKVLKHCPVKVYIHEKDQNNLKSPGADGLPMLYAITPSTPDVLIKDNDVLHIGQLSFLVIHTPGHSPGGICLYCQDKHLLISGDTLFKGTIGNLSFPTSEPDKMWESLKKLANLPPETAVYPGHGEMTYIKNESWLKNAKQIFN